MRLNSWVWLTILVLGLFTIGSAVAPCYAIVLDFPTEDSIVTKIKKKSTAKKALKK